MQGVLNSEQTLTKPNPKTLLANYLLINQSAERVYTSTGTNKLRSINHLPIIL